MSNFVSQQDFNEMLIWETAIIMLRKPERDMAYGDEASWHFIETVLTGENDRKACIHFLKSEAAHLAKLGTECIKIGSERSRELCSLLRNIEPNAGVNRITLAGRLPIQVLYLGWIDSMALLRKGMGFYSLSRL